MKAQKLVRSIAFQSHRYIGLMVALVLIIVGLTGSLLVFQSEVDDYAIEQQYGKITPTGEKMPISSILNIVQTKYPTGKIVGITSLPDTPYKVRVKSGGETTVAIANPYEVVRVGKQQPGEIDHKYGDTRVYFDRYSGEVLRVEDALKATRAENVINWFMPLHYGTFGGLMTRIMYVFVGLSPLVLFITGARMFQLRRLVKGKKKEVRDLKVAAQSQSIEN